MTIRPVHVEIGCGAVVRPAPSRITLGVDLDHTVLATAATSATDWRFVCADAMALPLRSGSCRTVRLAAVLHHLHPVDEALAELARVVSPGGTVTISDGVALHETEARALADELGQAGLPPEPIYGFDLDQLIGQIRATGLVVGPVAFDGTATFATPPHVSRTYASDRFVLTARRRDTLSTASEDLGLSGDARLSP